MFSYSAQNDDSIISCLFTNYLMHKALLHSKYEYMKGYMILHPFQFQYTSFGRYIKKGKAIPVAGRGGP
jgi:hypothetical protein